MLRETFKYFNITNGFEVISVGVIFHPQEVDLDPQVLLVGLIKCINSIQNLKLTKKKLLKLHAISKLIF